MLQRAADMGLSETEFWDMLWREFRRRERAWLKRQEQENDAHWERTLMIVNTIRGLVKGKTITLDYLKEQAAKRQEGGDGKPTKEDLQDMWAEIERKRQALTEKAEA